ncbi:hypothetical protein [Microbispora sp. GKU 823]|uniref:hypothetical protein n=1 Tax=Microbispora sp. GKU 823 TaxID=1652100 RepID=UPI0009A2F885|nr:hypothetical protein [Microbispora sp. GKU 823]OPG12663.1 hypothetical protein B1L11_13065 [Microbispora sp. GKU 823]
MPDHWPLFKLRLSTPRLQLRLPTLRGRRTIGRRLRLDHGAFTSPIPVGIHGLEPCLPHFGLR